MEEVNNFETGVPNLGYMHTLEVHLPI